MTKGPGYLPPGPSPEVEESEEQVALTAIGSGPHLNEPAQSGGAGSTTGSATSDSGSSAPSTAGPAAGTPGLGGPSEAPEGGPVPSGATDPKKGQGDEGAEVEGDGGTPRRMATDGPVGQDHGDSAPEPSPAASKGPGGRTGVAAVAVPALSGPLTTVIARPSSPDRASRRAQDGTGPGEGHGSALSGTAPRPDTG